MSTWYKKSFSTLLSGRGRYGRSFRPSASNLRKVTEPLPHVYSRENEFFYVVAGKLDVYVESEEFQVEAGECMFLPKSKPHACIIEPSEMCMLA